MALDSNIAFDTNGRRTAAGWAILVVLALLWMATGYFLPPLGTLLIVIHLVCLFVDVGMNGGRYAEFAPYNAGGAMFALIGILLAGLAGWN